MENIQASLILFEALLSGKGLQYILNKGSEILGNPLILSDLSFKVVAHTVHTTIDDPIWNELIEKGYASLDVAMNIKTEEEIQAVYKRDEPMYSRLPFLKHRNLGGRIAIGEKVVGHLAMLEYDQPITGTSIEIFKLLCRVIADELQKDTLIRATRGFMYESFMIDLLNRNITDLTVIDERLKYLEFNLRENLYFLVVRRQSNALEKPMGVDIGALLKNFLRDSIWIVYKGDLVILISRDKRNPLEKKEISRLIEILNVNKLIGGLSQPFHSIAAIPDFYRQALKSIELGLCLGEELPSTLYKYEDYAIYDLLDIAKAQADLLSFCTPLVNDLIDYDKVNNTNYTNTLTVYLTNGNNAKKTAYILGIHRNSLDHRIKKIEEILSIDLNQPETFFPLLLSFKVIEFANVASKSND